MCAQLAIQVVELLARRRVDRGGYREVVTRARRTHFEHCRIEIGRVPADDVDDRLREAVLAAAHHLDGERAREFEQADLRGDGGGGRCVHGGSGPGGEAPGDDSTEYAARPPPLQAIGSEVRNSVPAIRCRRCHSDARRSVGATAGRIAFDTELRITPPTPNCELHLRHRTANYTSGTEYM